MMVDGRVVELLDTSGLSPDTRFECAGWNPASPTNTLKEAV